jgi:hypothetical protein
MADAGIIEPAVRAAAAASAITILRNMTYPPFVARSTSSGWAPLGNTCWRPATESDHHDDEECRDHDGAIGPKYSND